MDPQRRLGVDQVVDAGEAVDEAVARELVQLCKPLVPAPDKCPNEYAADPQKGEQQVNYLRKGVGSDTGGNGVGLSRFGLNKEQCEELCDLKGSDCLGYSSTAHPTNPG